MIDKNVTTNRDWLRQVYNWMNELMNGCKHADCPYLDSLDKTYNYSVALL